ncbi:hypothetical protein SAMN05660657_05723 [Geodermatophilus amargosae]|uniref:Uncharacterized protein n=1 Tax=Geodermatophilus amargosae TaxID=1296565 RepID=A0A1I7DFL5_9ACTN|nr:hypothetical protein SAMN05660657_05723 [Geodermatophilus amargosae]
MRVTITVSGSTPAQGAFDAWTADLVPAVLDGAADVDVVLPPPRASTPPRSPVTPPVATAAPAPVAPTGQDCEAQLLAALAKYATGAAPIDPVVAAVPAGSADAARATAEDIRAWVTGDAAAWELAITDPPALFGSGQVIGSLCAGA